MNFRQRAESADINKIGRLAGRSDAVYELARALGDDYMTSGAAIGGVVGGFWVECVVASNQVRVYPGIALIPQVPAEPTYDPPVFFVEHRAVQTIDLTSLIDPADPRLVTIEVSAAEITFVQGVIDLWNQLIGMFTSSAPDQYPRVIGSEAVLHTTAGAPAAAPVVATGTVGRLPIAVIKLVGGQTSFTDEHASVLFCRPILEAVGRPPQDVRGGGLSVGEESGGTIDGLGFITVGACRADLAGLEADPSGFINYATFGRSVDGTSLASLVGSVQPVYAYAAPPPWGATYGAIAPREAWQYNPNEIDVSDPSSVIYGDGETFKSLVAETSLTPGRARRNCIVFFDTFAPSGTDVGLGSNAPRRVIDARGPHPDTAPGGAGSITLDDTQDPSWGSTQVVTETVYVGTVSSLGTADFVGQVYEGAGRVRLIDTVQIAGMTKRRPFRDDTSGVGATDLYPGKYPGMLVGDDPIFPESAFEVGMWLRWTSGSDGSPAIVKIYSKHGFGMIDGPATHGGWSMEFDTGTAGEWEITRHAIEVQLDASGSCEFSFTDAGLGSSVMWTPMWYGDLLLAAR